MQSREAQCNVLNAQQMYVLVDFAEVLCANIVYERLHRQRRYSIKQR